jgi:TolB-like protein/Flp pilus assembly protein TadD
MERVCRLPVEPCLANPAPNGSTIIAICFDGVVVVSTERVHLGPFVLDISRYELTCGGKPVRLERIPMDLLILLVRERGRLVSRNEIIERLWGKDVFFDTDNSINTAVRKIRRALMEDPEKPQYVETVQGKGYRLKDVGDTVTPPASSRVEVEKPGIMLAVLPFENLSGDPEQEYFSDGLTEETIMRFGTMSPRDLGVIARTSSMTYKHSNKSVLQIGRELRVDYVLEGSVRREAGRIRVTAQLIRVADQVHLWAENFDRPAHSVLDIQSEVGAAIAALVKLELSPEGARQLRGVRRIDPQAYDLYLHGRYHWARLTFPEMEKASEYFRKATERDDEFAMAFSGLADSLMILPINSDVPPKATFPEARLAVNRALGLDPTSAEVRNSDAAMKFWFDWDFAGAEAAARQAIRLNASYSLAHLYLAHILSNVGRHEEALHAIRHARMLDPFSLIANAMYGQFLYQAGRIDESIEELKATLEIESRFWITHICLAKSYERKGKYAEALQACENAWSFSGGNTEALSIAGYVLAASGDEANAEHRIHEMLERKKERYVPPYNLALVFAGLRRTKLALHWLQEAVEDRDVHMIFLRDHKWNGLREQPQFQRILELLGLGNS